MVNVTYEVDFNKTPIRWKIPEDAYGFETSSDFDLERNENFKEITFYNKTGKIKFKTSDILDKGDKNYFVIDFFPENIDDIELILPEKAFLSRPLDSINPPVSPSPERVYSDGRRIIIEWKNPSNNHLFVVYESENSFIWVYFVGIGILVLIVGVILRVRKARKVESSHLLDAEKKITDILAKSNNEMWQKELQIATGFTKARLSRNIRNMESRGIVKKVPYGTTNKVRLIEE